jgi:hypothetical protein
LDLPVETAIILAKTTTVRPGRTRKSRSSSGKRALKDPGLYFYSANGVVLSSLEQLPKALEEMPEDVYHHHASPSRNDFSNWIGDVFGKAELAERIRSMDRKGAAAAIREAL